MALHSWLALQFGLFVAHGVLGGSLLLLALVLFTLASGRRRPKPASRPRMQISQPAALAGSFRTDLRNQVIAAGERAFKAAESTLRDSGRPALLGSLALAAVAGLIMGRRL